MGNSGVGGEELLYRYACTRVVREALARFGPLALTLDRRYKTQRQRDQLDRALRAGVEDLGMALDIQHQDSWKERVLQVVDALCWTLFQKYERGDDIGRKMIQGKVVELRL